MRVAKAYRADYVPIAMALSDRTYMRYDQQDRRWSAAVVILVLNIAVFFAQYSNGRQSNQWFLEYGALSIEGLKRGFVWQLLTYQVLHGGIVHLIFNSLALYFFGRPVEGMLGTRTFVSIYLLSGLMGGIFQVVLGLFMPGIGATVGASAGICGIIAAFALLSPDSTIMVAFVIPLRARYFLPIVVAISVFLLLTGSKDGIAHGAHLGGTLFGAAYLKWLRDLTLFSDLWQRLRGFRRSRPIVKVRFPKSSSSWKSETPDEVESLPPTDFISKEVDPILEKLHAHGHKSLTEREKKILAAASAQMQKRRELDV